MRSFMLCPDVWLVLLNHFKYLELISFSGPRSLSPSWRIPQSQALHPIRSGAFECILLKKHGMCSSFIHRSITTMLTIIYITGLFWGRRCHVFCQNYSNYYCYCQNSPDLQRNGPLLAVSAQVVMVTSIQMEGPKVSQQSIAQSITQPPPACIFHLSIPHAPKHRWNVKENGTRCDHHHV